MSFDFNVHFSQFQNEIFSKWKPEFYFQTASFEKSFRKYGVRFVLQQKPTVVTYRPAIADFFLGDDDTGGLFATVLAADAEGLFTAVLTTEGAGLFTAVLGTEGAW